MANCLSMQKILTSDEMKEVDSLTVEKYGIPSLILMENAAHAVARAIIDKFGGSVKGKSVLVLCGTGNNGGDGAALARILWTQGADVVVYLFGKVEDTQGDARTNFEILKKLDPIIFFWEIEDPMDLFAKNIYPNTEIVVDALFGTGLSRTVEGDLKDFIEVCQEQGSDSYFVSLDIPSGLNSNLSHPIGEHIKADLTITFTAPKLANVFPPASNFNGELIVANIGSPQELLDGCSSKIFVSEAKDAKKWIEETKVKSDSYKKTRGTCLIIAGSESYSGAAVLTANACFSAGAGMVTLAVPKNAHQIIAAKTLDEIIVKPLENIEVSDEKMHVAAIGCGLSHDEEIHKLVREMVENRQTPMVLDAEALNILSPFELKGSVQRPLILTPHIREFERLLGREIGENKIAEAQEFAQAHNVILVLKGERTIIARPDGTVVINPTGNAGISRAGAGDTLTGIITSFLAQSFAVNESNIDTAFEAVVSALYIAGLASEIAAEKNSDRLLAATDIREFLGEAIKRINQ